MTLLRKGWTARLGDTALTRTPCGRGLDRRAPGEGHDPGLGRGVVGLAGLGPPAEHRGVVDDDPAPAAGVEVAEGGPGAAEGAGEGDVEDEVPLLVGHVHHVDLAAESGVVDGHVEAAVLGHRGVVERLDLRPRRSRCTARPAGAPRPAAGSSASASAASPSRRSWASDTTTVAPSSMHRLAVAKPMPVPAAAVTTTTLPVEQAVAGRGLGRGGGTVGGRRSGVGHR